MTSTTSPEGNNMNIHDIINFLCAQARLIDPDFAADTLDACCSNFTMRASASPRQVMVFNLIHDAYALNALADEVEAGTIPLADALMIPREVAYPL
jgi:hypothetical protein